MGDCSPGSWFQTRYFVLDAFESIAEGVFMSLVLHQVDLEIQSGHDEHLWVRISNKRIQGKLKVYSDFMIKKYMRSIKRKGVIRIRVDRKRSRIRWVMIDPHGFHAWMDSHRSDCTHESQRERSHPNHGSGRTRSDGERSFSGGGESHPPAAGSVVRIKRIYPSPFLGFAERLHSAVTEVRKVSSSSKPGSWAHSFRVLHRRDGVPVERISSILAWYEKTLKKVGDLIRTPGTYIPIAYSGPKWLQKWDSLEAAMERDRGKGGEEGPPMKVRLKVSKTHGSTREW